MTPKEPYLFDDFKRAFSELHSAIETEGRYLLLTGESGTGKTTLLRKLAETLDRCRFRILYLNLNPLSPVGLVRVLARALRVRLFRTPPETIQALSQVLAEESSRTLLFVDEAQALVDETFFQLRMLLETDLSGKLPMAVLLTGLPELRERLGAPGLFPFFRRFQARVEITGLRLEEARPFLVHYFGEKKAGRLKEENLSILFEHSRGLPGLLVSNLESVFRQLPDGPIEADTLTMILQS